MLNIHQMNWKTFVLRSSCERFYFVFSQCEFVLTTYSGKLPKNYNSEVDPDPERWIPKRERTYYKGKRQKKGAAVGEYQSCE